MGSSILASMSVFRIERCNTLCVRMFGQPSQLAQLDRIVYLLFAQTCRSTSMPNHMMKYHMVKYHMVK